MDNSELLVKLDNGKILCSKCSQTFLAMGSAKLHFFSCRRNKKKPKENLNHKEMEDSDDDPNKLWCICGRPENFRFMICCDSCQHWYHGNCIGISMKVGKEMEETGVEWFCPKCKSKEENTSQLAQTTKSRPWTRRRASLTSSKSNQNFDLNKNPETTLNIGGDEATKIDVENLDGTLEIPDSDDELDSSSNEEDANLNKTINLVSSTDDDAKKHNDDENYVQLNHINKFPSKKMGKEKLQTLSSRPSATPMSRVLSSSSDEDLDNKVKEEKKLKRNSVNEDDNGNPKMSARIENTPTQIAATPSIVKSWGKPWGWITSEGIPRSPNARICDTCKKVFNSRDNKKFVADHLKKCQKFYQFAIDGEMCSFCRKNDFSSYGRLLSHIEKHDNIKKDNFTENINEIEDKDDSCQEAEQDKVRL